MTLSNDCRASSLGSTVDFGFSSLRISRNLKNICHVHGFLPDQAAATSDRGGDCQHSVTPCLTDSSLFIVGFASLSHAPCQCRLDPVQSNRKANVLAWRDGTTGDSEGGWEALGGIWGRALGGIMGASWLRLMSFSAPPTMQRPGVRLLPSSQTRTTRNLRMMNFLLSYD